MATSVPVLEAPAAPIDPAPGLEEELRSRFTADQLLTRPIDRIRFASDASFYRLIPRAVVLTAGIDDVRALFAASRAHRVPLTFRAAGTSLSGQSITDGLLVEVARHWRRVRVEDEGRRVRVQPGAIGGRVNLELKPYGARIGPDPASINTCTLGGILANNSSGMCCGVAQNAYHTLESLTFVLPSGTTIDTSAAEADERFRAAEPRIAEGLLALRRDIQQRPALLERIRAKYRMKNTTGYSLNALVDFERPVDIMRHLLVGSEGTLGFIAEAVLRTVPDLPVKYTGLLLFPDLRAACAVVPTLRDAGARAVEIMDRAALRSVERQPGVPAELVTLPDGATGLLIEFQARLDDERAALESLARDATGAFSLLHAPRFTHDPLEQARLWSVRQGLFPSVGAVRLSGTTVIIEDVAFPVEQLADASLNLIGLFRAHRYDEAIVFGHAKDGNLHFVITQSFRDETAVDRYARFMDDVVRLVVERYDGALKAEHGTGRNMAPFVEAEWGPEAMAIMRRLKALVDPDNLLNPGVIINPSPRAHLEDLKALPTVEPEVDRCIECGYCEPMCPSRDLTTTPRQRIVIRREMARLQEGLPFDSLGVSASTNRQVRSWQAGLGECPARGNDATESKDGNRRPEGKTESTPGGLALLRSLERDFPYDVLETCAVDGLCATACPVNINTGDLTKRFRELEHSPRGKRAALWCATHFAAVERAARTALRTGRLTASVAGDGVLTALTGGANRAVSGLFRRGGGPGRPVSGASMPRWLPPMPGAAPRWQGLAPGPEGLRDAEPGAAVLYFPTCLTRVLGRLPDEPRGPGLAETVVTLARRAGMTIAIPPDAGNYCCGVPFSSKGYRDAHAASAARLVERLWEWSQYGRVPVLLDTSPCTYGLRTSRDVLPQELQPNFDALKLLDAVGFAHELLPRLRVTRPAGHAILHPVCSVTKMGLGSALASVGQACAARATIPADAGCCGFAGDRGFLVPELTASATRLEARHVRDAGEAACYSSGRTCEIGLARATGRPWRSLLYLLEETTRPQD